ncbi:hypothetical protein OC842_002778 [Tilletia horrida]|uniref:Plectin/eS10 N-terminal domain-containing protein n=1 Tax=Tilletia horrida TaxID=155126 RepID=A0AAN6GHD3_9BASI|nr:hypothetical protein OC842_002778 [Tilletia horrida]
MFASSHLLYLLTSPTKTRTSRLAQHVVAEDSAGRGPRLGDLNESLGVSVQQRREPGICGGAEVSYASGSRVQAALPTIALGKLWERVVLIPKANRNAIYSQLFRDGVLVAPKNFEVEHPELEGIPNLEVVKAMQSLTSKGFVHTQFSWQWYFYVLTNEGLEYLREYLHLPSEIVPATHKRPQRPARSAPGPREGGAYRAPRGDRDEYRSRRDAGSKEGPGEGFRPRYAAAGVGRGAPQ